MNRLSREIIGWISIDRDRCSCKFTYGHERQSSLSVCAVVYYMQYLQIIFAIGAAEWVNHDGKISMMDMHKDSDRVVGEFSHPIYGAWYLKGKSEAQIADLKLKELKNGRLAMMAIGGLVHQTIVSGSETLGAFPNSQLYGL